MLDTRMSYRGLTEILVERCDRRFPKISGHNIAPEIVRLLIADAV